jgi:hypothetical protein
MQMLPKKFFASPKRILPLIKCHASLICKRVCPKPISGKIRVVELRANEAQNRSATNKGGLNISLQFYCVIKLCYNVASYRCLASSSGRRSHLYFYSGSRQECIVLTKSSPDFRTPDFLTGNLCSKTIQPTNKFPFEAADYLLVLNFVP